MSNPDRPLFGSQWPDQTDTQLVGLGLNSVDWICVLPRFPDHNTKLQMDGFHRRGGGQVATACALCARYGMKVRYVGRVGDDEVGEFSRRDLEREPMDTACLETVPGAASQFAVILVDRPSGERTILWDRDPSLHYRKGDLKQDWILGGQILHLDGHDQPASVQAARWAREAGMRVSLDIDKVQPGVEELLALTDYLIPGSDFARAFAGTLDWREALEILARSTTGFVALSRGREGAVALWEGEFLEVPGLPVSAVDTTGAGDVFHGAFLHALLQGWPARRCLRFANAAAALSCTRYGARAGIPALDEVLKLVSG